MSISPLLPVYARTDIAFTHGEGAWLVSETGRRYLDFASGVGVNLLGHAHPSLTEALRDQIGRSLHLSNLYRIPEQETLAERLTKISFADTVFFANSGAEAVECALKMTRAFHAKNGEKDEKENARSEIISFSGAFHGRTLAALAASGRGDAFPPALQGFQQIPFGDTPALARAVSEKTAGILIEPVQGEGGIKAAPSLFLRSCREISDRAGALLLFDEVQCGMGRTGFLFAHERAGVTPDILMLAKGLGGGVPIGCALATARAASGMETGSHGSTFGGNPLAMRAAHAVLDRVLEPDFLPHLRGVSLHLRQKLAMLRAEHPQILKGFRGEGLMIGLECLPPASEVAESVFEEALLTVPAAENVLRLLPPLIISEEEAAEAVARLDRAFQRLRPSPK